MFRRTRVGAAVRATFGGIAGVLAFSGMPAHAQAQQSLERVEITGSLLRRIDISPGISCSDTSIVFRPHSASDRSLTLKS